MAEKEKQLNVLNDFAFKKCMGEKGDEAQLMSFLNAVLRKTRKSRIASLEIIENKEMLADIQGGKTSRLDVRAILEDNTRTNIEVQLKNEYNMEKRSLRYWALEYTKGIVEGQDYIEQSAVIVINILDFGYIPIEKYHTSFHIYEDTNKDYMLTDALEMHYLDMDKWRKVKEKSLSDEPHRWMIYFDRHSPPELIEEVTKMDIAIEAARKKMEMIRRDPELQHAYDMYEETRIEDKMGLYEARKEGWRIGRQEGRQEGLQDGVRKGKLEVAKKLKSFGSDIEQIKLLTGLSLEEIAKL
jgi:predicted transposase/invertase (TIGR01784 family)